MKNEFHKMLERLGEYTLVLCGSNTYGGKTVILPIRFDTKLNGGNQTVTEGLNKPERYVMYGSCELLRYASRGDEIKCGGTSYKLLWKDEFHFKSDSYTKAHLKKISG